MLFLAALSVASLTGCANKAAQQGFERPPAPVSVTAAIMQDVPTYIDAIGKTVAREVVSIQPQVSGRIIKIHITNAHVLTPVTLESPIQSSSCKKKLHQRLAEVAV